jgi:hypothetical protein
MVVARDIVRSRVGVADPTANDARPAQCDGHTRWPRRGDQHAAVATRNRIDVVADRTSRQEKNVAQRKHPQAPQPL